MTGGLFPPPPQVVTVRFTTWVVEDPWLSVTVNVAVEVPAVGVGQEKSPVEVENVAPEGSVVETVRGSPSGSMIESEKLIAAHVVPVALVGPVMTGGLLGPTTVVVTVLLSTQFQKYSFELVRAVLEITVPIAVLVETLAFQVIVPESPGDISWPLQVSVLPESTGPHGSPLEHPYPAEKFGECVSLRNVRFVLNTS